MQKNEVEKIISVVNEHWENKPIRHISQTMAKKLDTISFYYADLLRYLKEENASKQVTDRIADEINPVLMNELDSYSIKAINDELIKEFEDKPLTALPEPKVIDVLVKAVTDNVTKE